MKDERYIQLALQLAEKGRGKTSPNPMVGAVVVKGNRIIARGYHQELGGPHAEAVALHACGDKARDATLYVNLEPCCHYGKTPPCTDLLIQSGIKKVVCSTIDPNPLVNGKGIKRLRKAGIEVGVGILERKARELNEAYFKYITTGLPFVVLRVTGTLDGKVIESKKSAKLKRRDLPFAYKNFESAGIDAILCDAGKVKESILKQADMHLPLHPISLPQGERGVETLNPRLILTGNWNEILRMLKTIKHKNIFLAPIDRKMAGAKKVGEMKVWEIKKRKDGGLDLLPLLKKIGEEGITCFLVEGGNKILTPFLKQKLVDKIWYQISPNISGAGEEPFGDLGIKRISDAVILKNCEVKQSGNTLLVVGCP